MIDIGQVINKIVQQFNPQAIYIFGSYSRGTQTESSDLDMLVVDEHVTSLGSKTDLAFEISKALYPRDFHLDLLTYTLDTFKRKIKQNDPFLSQIIKEGKKVYERA